jgi:hypothetical protein
MSRHGDEVASLATVLRDPGDLEEMLVHPREYDPGQVPAAPAA